MSKVRELYPQLADVGKTEHLWENPNWVAEEKFDGSRYLLHIDGYGIPIGLTSRRTSSKTGNL